MASNAETATTPRRRGWGRFFLRAGLVLVVLLVLLVALAPMIASRVAPGVIEAAAADQIKGTVRVDRVKVGWFSDAAVGPVEVLDPEGRTVARLEVAAPVSLWKVVGGRWWSAESIDVGTVTLAGMVDIIQRPGGTTNLDEAIEPDRPSPPKQQQPSAGGGPRNVRAALNVTDLDIRVREQNADGSFAADRALDDVKGTISADYASGSAGGGGGGVVAKGEMGGQYKDAPGAAPVATSVRVDADLKQKAGAAGGWSPAGLEKMALDLGVANAPLTVVDALASLGGALVEAAGQTADLNVTANGNSTDATIALDLRSSGLNADAALALRNGVLTAGTPLVGGETPAPVRLAVASTGFLSRLPATAQPVQKAAETVRLTKAPKVELTIDQLSIPLPQGAASGGGFDLKAADLRGATIVARARIEGVEGQVALPRTGAEGATGAAPAADWRSFAVQPLVAELNIPDLAQPVRITTGTQATLDGQSAGALKIDAAAAGLLDANGRVRALQENAGLAENLRAEATLTGVATALVQPFVASLPVEMERDVGPTLDLSLLAVTAGPGAAPAGAAAGAGAIPAVDATLKLTSRNINADGQARYENDTVTTVGDGFRLRVERAAPLLAGVMEKPVEAGQPAAAPAFRLGGTGRVEVTARDLVANTKQLSGLGAILANVKGNIGVALSDLTVTPVPAAPAAAAGEPPALAPAPVSPIQIESFGVTARLDPKAEPAVEVASAMRHENNPFGLNGTMALPGIKTGLPQGGTPIDTLIAARPTGTIELKDVPRSVLAAVPATAKYAAEPSGDGTDAAVARLVQGLVGAGATATVTLAPAEGQAAQTARVAVATQAQGAGADLRAVVARDAARIAAAEAFVNLTPQAVNPVLAAATKPAAPEAGQPAPAPADPPRLGGPVRMTVTVPQPIVVPLTAEGSPDWARAGDAGVRLATDNELVIENLAMGGTGEGGQPAPAASRTLRLRDVAADATVPLSFLAADKAAGKGKQLKATLGANALDGAGAPLAKLTGQATAAGLAGESLDATLQLNDLNTAAAESILRLPWVGPGALGDKADVALRVTPQDNSALPAKADGTRPNLLTLRAQLTSPRVTGANLGLNYDETRVWLVEPLTVTWTPDPAFINTQFLSGGGAGPAPAAEERRGEADRPRRRREREAAENAPAASDGGSVRVGQASPIQVTVGALSAAVPKSDPGAPAVGPLKPGVFALDATVTAASLSMIVDRPPASPAAGQPGAPAGGPQTLTLEGIKVSVKSLQRRAPERPSEPAAAAQAGADQIEANVTVDRVAGAGAAGQKQSTARVKLDRLADAAGVLTTDRVIIDADANFEAFPTPIVDALAQKGGLINEALGPTLTLTATARNVSTAAEEGSGSLEAQAVSERATASLKGRIRKDGVFVQNGPTQVKLSVITPNLVQELAGSLPLIESLEKTPQDDPAVVVAEGLKVPMDNDLRKLDGKLTVDPGVARFTTANFFGKLLKEVGARQSGQVGKRLEPFVVTIDKGVAHYDKFKLPLGEFTAETRGSVDLVNRRIDVVTYLPFFALTDEFAGVFSSGLAGKLGVIDRNTMVPISVRGPLDNPSTGPDIELFLKETGGNIVNQPGKIIEGIGDIIGGGKKDKDKDGKK